VQILLRHEDSRLPVLLAHGRDDAIDQHHRALLKRPDGLAPAVAFDASVGRIRGVAGDAGQLERARVRPRAVVIPVHEERRPVGHDRVQLLPGRNAAVEQVQRPAGAEDPRRLGMRPRVRADDPVVVVPGVALGEIHAQPVQAAGRRVHVRVLERRQQQPAPKVDHLGGRARPLADLVVGSHGQDAALPDGDRLRPRVRRVDGVDAAAQEGQLGRGGHQPRSLVPPGS
jgi:hypothetical protein